MNARLKTRSKDFDKGCVCLRKENDLSVKNGLAVTPSQMYDMAKRGIPITTANQDMQFYDGEINPSWELPLDKIRGVDIGELWQSSMDARRKFKQAYKDDIAKYGTNVNSDKNG